MIVTVVRPVNFQVACYWMEQGVAVSADNLVDGSMDPISANQLFALVCQLYEDEAGAVGRAKESLENKISARLSAKDEGV